MGKQRGEQRITLRTVVCARGFQQRDGFGNGAALLSRCAGLQNPAKQPVRSPLYQPRPFALSLSKGLRGFDKLSPNGKRLSSNRRRFSVNVSF